MSHPPRHKPQAIGPYNNSCFPPRPSYSRLSLAISYDLLTMKVTTLLALTLSLALAHASWFGGTTSSNQNTAHGTPSQADLQAAVRAHWDSATVWSADQYNKAQVAFAGLKSDAFDSWDESRLREFLLEQGVVNPQGPASSSSSSQSKSGASIRVPPAYTAHASKSATSVRRAASASAVRALDDSKDYVYSTWDDNRLRAYLEEHGIVEPEEAPRSALLLRMRDAYARVAEPVYQAWADSYLHEWLVHHGVLHADAKSKRDTLFALMQKYYYDVQDTVWSGWDESQMKDWLVRHNIIKSNAELKKEKMHKLLTDNYAHAQDTVWGAWHESDMREWLVAHGYLRSDAQKTRDELAQLMNDKYTDYSARTAPYLVWPDARLRAFLRGHGVSEEALPTDRPGSCRRRACDTCRGRRARAHCLHGEGDRGWRVEAAEEKLGAILEVLSGGTLHVGERMREGAERVRGEKVEL
ncbi:hypothetical protein A0H81_05467 [Grifola frondosa]|uniref:Meiotic sister chromatid recombination protein 1 n=1 Tax=Grifola frondosa TaxID=5627 RepID=A0A1C7MCI5_GRIFR|nr:hypothetical protein A0H81_05467 [Grifola frondosa]